jgi:hypothetical protein
MISENVMCQELAVVDSIQRSENPVVTKHNMKNKTPDTNEEK